MLTNIVPIACLKIILNLNVSMKFRCKRKDHTLLHMDDETTRAIKEISPRKGEIVSYNTHVISKEKAKSIPIDLGCLPYRRTILPTALIYIQVGELFTVGALLDAGSENSFVSLKVQQKPINSCESTSYQEF